MSMNKGVTIAGGVVTGIFILLPVLGGVLTGSAGENLENIDDDPSPYYTKSQDGSATFTYVDEDRKGSVAFQVLVSLDYVDSDEDGYVDGCSDFNVTVTDADGTDVTEDVISRGCTFDEWTEEDQIHDGLVISAYVCETFYSDANCTINSDYTVSVTDSNNESVDAIVRVGDYIIPIDAKFSLDNYNKMIESNDKDLLLELEKKFKADIKNRIDETSKYIRPNEKTTDYAYMFIPADGLYQDLLNSRVGSLKINQRDIVS